MVLSLPLLSLWEGRGKKQRGQTAPIPREGEMVPLQSSKVTVLTKWQQHQTQKEARAYAGITRQSHELQFLRLSKESEGKNWSPAPTVAAVTVILLRKFTCFLKTVFLNKMYANPSPSSHCLQHMPTHFNWELENTTYVRADYLVKHY